MDSQQQASSTHRSPRCSCVLAAVFCALFLAIFSAVLCQLPCAGCCVPQEISINDIVRGKVTWNTDNLGDFVVLRSNGLPVYNFCVAIDDALMGITHVLRAEEHLPNTLRQVRVRLALGFNGLSCDDCDAAPQQPSRCAKACASAGI